MSKNSTTPTIEAVIRRCRRSSFGTSCIPMESSASLPIVWNQDGEHFIAFFLFTTRAGEAGSNRVICAPFADLVIQYPSGLLLSYAHGIFADLPHPKGIRAWDPIGTFPHPAVSSMTPRAYLAERQKLLEQALLIIGMGEHTAEHERLWKLLMDPCLAPYYCHIAPASFRTFLATIST